MFRYERWPFYDKEVYMDYGEQPERLEIQIGSGLSSLINKKNGEPLLNELEYLRNYFDAELGLPVSKIPVKENKFLEENEYILLFNGVQAGRALINPESNSGEPPEQIIREHLVTVIRKNITSMLDHCQVNKLVCKVRTVNPDIVDHLFFLKNDKFSATTLKALLNLLLSEEVSIRDMNTILETVADYGSVSYEPVQVVDKVRQRLALGILRKYADKNNIIHGIVVTEEVSLIIQESLYFPPDQSEKPKCALERTYRRKLTKKILSLSNFMKEKGFPTVFLCTSVIRQGFAEFLGDVLNSTDEDFCCVSDMEILAVDGQITFQKEGELTLKDNSDEDS